MREIGLPIIILIFYFVVTSYVAIYSGLYLRKTKQARVDTGMEIPKTVVKITKVIPYLAAVLATLSLLFLIAEVLTLFSAR